MYTEKHVLPCGCGYPFCHIVIMSNNMEKNVIYRIFYGDYDMYNTWFKRLKHWFKEGKEAEFMYDTTVHKDDLEVLKQNDPTLKEFEVKEVEIPEYVRIVDKVYFNKKDLSWKDFWEFLTTGGIQKKMLRCFDKDGCSSYLMDLCF